jgi:hypothetical protein
MTNNQSSNKYDLEERTAKFGEHIISFCRSVKSDKLADPILNQLLRAGTSIGANYMEANGASSKRDFQIPVERSPGTHSHIPKDWLQFEKLNVENSMKIAKLQN